MRKYFLVLFLIFLVSLENATSLIPIPIKDQIRSSDAVVHGFYNRSKGTKRPTEEVVVQEHSLNLISIVGVNYHTIVNKRNYTFLTFGDTLRIKEGEEVVLFLKSTNHGYRVNHHALGKYKVIHKGRKKYLINEAFPKNEQLSNLSFEKVNTYIEEKFGKVLGATQNRFVYKGSTTNKGRSIASLSTSSNSKHTGDKKIPLHFIWPLIALGLVGFYHQKKGKKNIDA